MDQAAFYRSVLDNLYDGVYFVDNDRRITFWNKGAERIAGYRSDDVVGTLCNDNLLKHIDKQGRHLCEDGCPLLSTIITGSSAQCEVYLKHKDGHRVPVLVRASPMLDERDNIIGAVEIFSDNTSQVLLHRRVDELSELALADHLTQIANRRYLENTIYSKLSDWNQLGWPFGIFFLDVDSFKTVNDTYGHDMGDAILKMVAQTIANNVRPFDVAGRWAGDEFMVVLPNVKMDQMENVANRLVKLVESSSIQCGDAAIHVTISLGAVMVQKGDTLQSLEKRADEYLYQSKQAGKNRITVQKSGD